MRTFGSHGVECAGPERPGRERESMSVWLEQARSFPNGVVATPHYLASNAGLAMLASGGDAGDAAPAPHPLLGGVAAYMCGGGGGPPAIAGGGHVNASRGARAAPPGRGPPPG